MLHALSQQAFYKESDEDIINKLDHIGVDEAAPENSSNSSVLVQRVAALEVLAHRCNAVLPQYELLRQVELCEARVRADAAQHQNGIAHQDTAEVTYHHLCMS